MTEHPSADRPHHSGADPDAAEVMAAPQVAKGDVRWLYYSGFYDGPLNGRVMVAGEALWAQKFEECTHLTEDDDDAGRTACGFYRRYRLIRLAPEADAEEARRHDLFRTLVGNHWEFSEEGQRLGGFDSSRNPNWHSFYDMQKGWPKWTATGDLVGWFER